MQIAPFVLWWLCCALGACAVNPSEQASSATDANSPAIDTSADDSLPALSISRGELREDLEALYRGFQSAHYDLIVTKSKQEYDAIFASSLERISDSQSRLDARRLLQRFTAFGIEALIEERNAARATKNYARADEIRNELLAADIELEDSREGTDWRRKD